MCKQVVISTVFLASAATCKMKKDPYNNVMKDNKRERQYHDINGTFFLYKLCQYLSTITFNNINTTNGKQTNGHKKVKQMRQ